MTTTSQPKLHRITAYERFHAQYRIPVPNQYPMYTIPLCTIATTITAVMLTMINMFKIQWDLQIQQSSPPPTHTHDTLDHRIIIGWNINGTGPQLTIVLILYIDIILQ